MAPLLLQAAHGPAPVCLLEDVRLDGACLDGALLDGAWLDGAWQDGVWLAPAQYLDVVSRDQPSVALAGGQQPTSHSGLELPGCQSEALTHLARR